MDFFDSGSGAGGQSTLQAFDNIHGGKNINFSSGESVTSMENIHDGKTFYENNQQIAETRSNIFGGVDVYENSQKTGYSQELIDGQTKMFGADNQMLGEVQSGVGDSTQAVNQGQVMMTTSESATGLSSVMHYDNPLAHVETFLMPPFHS